MSPNHIIPNKFEAGAALHAQRQLDRVFFIYLISLSTENVSGGFLRGLLTAISLGVFTYDLRKFSRMNWHRGEDFDIIFRQFFMTGRYHPST